MKFDETEFPASSYKETVLAPIFYDFKEHFFIEMMTINYAHAVMLAEEEIIKEEDAGMIISALKEIEDEIELESLEYTGEYEDVFFYIENELKKKIGIQAAGRLHTGRSRNDMDITMYKMKLKDYLGSLIKKLLNLTSRLIKIADENKETIIVAYTHGQPAQPTTLGHYLGALIEILERDLDRLFHSYQIVDKSSMGAAAITTTGFELNRERMAELLGFSEIQENSYGCIASVDYLTEVYSHLKVLYINLGRFIQDLGQWTSFDLSHLYVPDQFVQVSSIMPQKRNPVPVEHMRILSSMTIGYCDTVINSMHNTPFTDMNDAEDPIQVVGYKAFTTGERVLRLLTDFISGLRVNEEKIKKHIEESYVTITELADSLVREEKISFRQAHEITSQLVKLLVAEEKPIDELGYDSFKKIFKEIIGRIPDISEEKLVEVIKAEYFINVRECFGGPGLKALSQSLDRYISKLDQYQNRYNEIKSSREKAFTLLKKAINNYLQ